MGKVSVFTGLFVCIIGFVTGQIDFQKGGIRTTLTISTSNSFATSSNYFYFNGQLGVYLNDKVSTEGEGYYFLGKFKGETNEYTLNHSLYWGLNRHFIKNGFDFFIGIQPGVTFTKIAYPVDYANVWDSRKLAINPSASMVTGVNYYFSKYCHFFLHYRVLYALHLTDFKRDISDMRFSAGLGFQLIR